ncbi:solute carrier family 2, facilitated glucose transporter member 12-like isoform X1 [Nematostella vectensis]|uniref:solute carrier family 2, facilitated glucose transporter member 12-like isoform X1 n=1 Tax=Nematostella vectensis TaxID=45351 RepID=UPI002077568B|nr:solute carrier family 2, facilitated glucose transporter member 12-like isoform X1 [Nematostella vectensis]
MAAIGGVLFGYDIGIVSGAVLQLRQEFLLSCLQQEMVVSSMLIGAVFASVTGGFVIDFLGRRLAIIITSLVFLAGAIILAVAQSYPVLIIGRLIVGFGVSLSAIAECIYISEIAPAKYRGMLVSLNELGICSGLLAAYLVNYIFINLPAGWRYMFGLSGVPALIQGIGMYFLPMSPRWLIVKGKDEQACKSIAQLHWEGDPHEELMRIKSGFRTEYKYGLCDLFSKMDNMRKRMFIGGGLVFFQQITGQPTVVYYASTIFEDIGFHSGTKATLASLGIGLAKLVATILSLSLVDKGGRRRFLLMGVSVMAASIITLGVVSTLQPLKPPKKCYYTQDGLTNQTTGIPYTDQGNVTDAYMNRTTSADSVRPVNPVLRYLALAGLVMFVAGYSFGFGPVSWLLLSEIFPSGIKGRAFSLATVLNWGTNVFVSFTFLDLLGSIGTSGTFFFYGLICVIAIVFIYKYVPETKNKTLEQISAELNSKKAKSLCPAFRLAGRRRMRRTNASGSTHHMLLDQSQVQI